MPQPSAWRRPAAFPDGQLEEVLRDLLSDFTSGSPIKVRSGLDRLTFANRTWGSAWQVGGVSGLRERLGVIEDADWSRFQEELTGQLHTHIDQLSKRWRVPIQASRIPVRHDDHRIGLIGIRRISGNWRGLPAYTLVVQDEQLRRCSLTIEVAWGFDLTIVLNGHGPLMAALDRYGIEFTQADNSITACADFDELRRQGEFVVHESWAAELHRLAAEWLPPLAPMWAAGAERWCVSQVERHTDILGCYPGLCPRLLGATSWLLKEFATLDQVAWSRATVEAGFVKGYGKHRSFPRYESVVNDPALVRALRSVKKRNGDEAVKSANLRKHVDDLCLVSDAAHRVNVTMILLSAASLANQKRDLQDPALPEFPPRFVSAILSAAIEKSFNGFGPRHVLEQIPARSKLQEQPREVGKRLSRYLAGGYLARLPGKNAYVLTPQGCIALVAAYRSARAAGPLSNRY